MKSLTHLSSSGEARMVDVGSKPVQCRTAAATGMLLCQAETIANLRAHALPKGDALAIARIAGILAAKRTDELIPLCHNLPLDRISVDFEIHDASIRITSTARTSARTGVEMEALTAVSIAALTLYDMLKAVDHTMEIQDIHIISKTKA